MNKTSGYLDLSILYGDVKKEQDLVRTHKDGKLKPDSFSEPRLQAFPAACCVLLVMLNRFHNHVVEQLAAVNENGRFNKPAAHLSEEDAQKAWAKYDEDLFQTGRLYVSGYFVPFHRFSDRDLVSLVVFTSTSPSTIISAPSST